MIKDEIKGIYLFLRRNRSEVPLLAFVVLFIALKAYHQLWNPWFSYLLYYAVLPVAVIVLLLRKNPMDFGFRFVNPRIWGLHVALVCLIGLPLPHFALIITPVREYYGMEHFNPLIYFWRQPFYCFPESFIFAAF